MSRVLTILLTACVVILTILCGTAVALSVGLLDPADLRGGGKIATVEAESDKKSSQCQTKANNLDAGKGATCGGKEISDNGGISRANVPASPIRGTLRELEEAIKQQMRAYANGFSAAIDQSGTTLEFKKVTDSTRP